MEDLYLIDNNVLSRLTRAQRAAAFLRNHCRITADVLYEARGYADEIDDVPVEEVTAAVLNQLHEVMAHVEPHDTSLVDLYASKGSADPVLIATALARAEEEQQTFLPRRVIIVTGDKAVAQMATRLGIEQMGFDSFVSLLEAAV